MTPRCEQADQELRRIRLAMPELLSELEQRLRTPTTDKPFPLLHFGEKHKVTRLDASQVGAMEDWFFIGDLHGDFYALHTLLGHAEALRADCRILFLGDMVDRGAMPIECIFLLLEWGLRHPGRLVWIAGNHDVAFSCGEQGEFNSAVKPAELLNELNAKDLFAGTRRRIGNFFIEMAQRLPRALLFPDGLLATHGGFPLSDLQVKGKEIADESAYLEWLNSKECLFDFTWTRITRMPKKIPDRYSSGSEYGFMDFEAFCQLKPDWFPVKNMVNGHQHPANGFELHATYKVNRALTLLGMGLDEFTRKYNDSLHLGQGATGTIPAVIHVPVNRDEREMLLSGSQRPAQPTPPAPSSAPVAPATTVAAAPAVKPAPAPLAAPVAPPISANPLIPPKE